MEEQHNSSRCCNYFVRFIFFGFGFLEVIGTKLEHYGCILKINKKNPDFCQVVIHFNDYEKRILECPR